MNASLERLRRRRDEMDDEGGFTLIELLIVIVILGILAAIVVFAVQNLTGSSAQAACKSDYKTVEIAAEAYNAQVGEYPGVATAVGPIPNDANASQATYVATGTSPGIDDLLGTVTLVNNSPSTLGPWLRDNPLNPTHYEIVFTAAPAVAPATGYVTTEQVDTPAGVAIGGPATGTIADCSKVT